MVSVQTFGCFEISLSHRCHFTVATGWMSLEFDRVGFFLPSASLESVFSPSPFFFLADRINHFRLSLTLCCWSSLSILLICCLLPWHLLFPLSFQVCLFGILYHPNLSLFCLLSPNLLCLFTVKSWPRWTAQEVVDSLLCGSLEFECRAALMNFRGLKFSILQWFLKASWDCRLNGRGSSWGFL